MWALIPTVATHETRELHLSRVLVALERPGFAADYAESLTHSLALLEDRLDEAVRLAGERRVRVWRFYLRAARSRFRTGFTSVYQVRAALGLKAAPVSGRGGEPAGSLCTTAVLRAARRERRQGSRSRVYRVG